MTPVATEAQIEIFAKQTNKDELFQRFKKIKEEDSVFINIFINEGFDPVINTESHCAANIICSDGFVLVENEFRDDWDEIEFEEVRCAIRFECPEDIEREVYKPMVKAYFEQLLDISHTLSDEEYREMGVKLKRPRSECIKQSITGIGDPLPDGRRVITVCGGEYSDKVNELLSGLDPGVLVPKKLDLMEICF
jgi:hypothetical protein